MMGVEIDIEHTRLACIQECEDRKHRIVKIAKPAGMVPHGVMRASRRMVSDPTFRCQPGRQHGPADGRACALEHTLEDRVFHRPDAVAFAHLLRNRPIDFTHAQRFDIGRIVISGQISDARDRAVDIGVRPGPFQPTQLLAKRQHRADPCNPKRMARAIAGLAIDLAADEPGVQ